MKRVIFLLVAICLICATPLCYASDNLVIESVAFSYSLDSEGCIDDENVNVVVKYTAEKDIDQVSLVLVTDENADILISNNPEVIYFDQFTVSGKGVFIFSFSKDKLYEAFGEEYDDGVNLWL